MRTTSPQRRGNRGAAASKAGARSSSERAEFPVVAIAASADTRQGIHDLLATIPAASGMAYVVVQRAALARRPLTTAVLATSTALPIIEAGDQTALEPDHVYLLPVEGAFVPKDRVLSQTSPVALERPLDAFLTALANDCGPLARAVVLATDRVDAVEGLRAIAQRGGLTFVQDPAIRQGGIRRATAAQVANVVASAPTIARELVAHSSQGSTRSSSQWTAHEQIEFERPPIEPMSLAEQRRAVDEGPTASNEALAVANEELRTTNEELSALNEQLELSREQLLDMTEELRRRNTALDRANDDLLNVLASVDIPIVIVDAERRIRRYLRSTKGLVNLIPSDVGRPINQLRTNVEAPDLDRWIAQVIERGEVAEYEVRDADGRWRRLQIRPYKTRGNVVDGALVSLVDIDALKRAISGANTTRDRARMLFETVPLPIVVLDATLRIESANRSFSQLTQVDAASIIGRPFLELARPEADKMLRLQLEGLLADDSEPLRDLEVECRLPDATLRLVLLDGCSIPSGNGQRSLLLVLHDVTARRRREIDQTRARAEAVQRFLNEAGRLLLAVSLEANLTLEKLAQLAVPALGDLCLIDVVAENHAVRSAAIARADAAHAQVDELLTADEDSTIANVVNSGRSVLEAELDAAALQRIGGARAQLLRSSDAGSYLCVALHGRKGVLGALSLARKRSAQRYGLDDLALAEGLGQRAGVAIENAQLYRAARDAINLRDEFLAIASHELRTPLTALQLQLENLQANLPPEPKALTRRKSTAERVEHALRHTQRLGRLVDSLLVVSRIAAGRLALQIDEVDLSDVVRDVVERMQIDADRAQCRVELDVALGVTGRWDALRLEQVITNLLSNAFRYAPGALVRVSLRADDHRATLRVEDNGPGIPKERQPHIFDRYEIAGERSTAGLGLGLYIIRQIVEAHGGTVRVDAERKVGAGFVVELPRSGPPAGAP
jgi:PAS domain S-box-containing protein